MGIFKGRDWAGLRLVARAACTAAFGVAILSGYANARAVALSAAESAEQPAALGGTASARIPVDHMQQYSSLAVTWLREYLMIDTTNPPGNEMKAVGFFKKILDEEGIENRTFEYAPGRGDFWARLPHTTAEGKRPIILLNHMDVVTSDPTHWQVPPFSGEMKGGYLWGRGAQDMKDEGMAQLVAMVMLKREQVPLDRDVIFLAVSDEEAEGTGTDWFIANKRDLLENAEFLINEGGESLLQSGRVKYIGVDVGEKTTYWLHVVAHGRPGHASRPNPDSAPNRLVRALDRILAYRTPLRVLPVVNEFLVDMAPYESPQRAREYQDIYKAIEDKRFQQEVGRDESLNFLLRDTISLTMMGASGQTNVIPAEAWANLDVRPPTTRCSPPSARFRPSIFPALRWSRTSPADTPRASASARWASTPTASIPIRPQKKKALRSTATTSGYGLMKCGVGRGLCSTCWRRWRGSN